MYDMLAYRDVRHDMTVLSDNAEASVNSNEDLNATPKRNLVVRGSLKSKLPPTLIIKSANLRVLDPVGQG